MKLTPAVNFIKVFARFFCLKDNCATFSSYVLALVKDFGTKNVLSYEKCEHKMMTPAYQKVKHWRREWHEWTSFVTHLLDWSGTTVKPRLDLKLQYNFNSLWNTSDTSWRLPHALDCNFEVISLVYILFYTLV